MFSTTYANHPRERCPFIPSTHTASATVTSSPWRALIVHPARERFVLTRLLESRIPAYLPIASDRPLIPGYVFAQFDGIDRAWIYSRSPYIVRALETAGHLDTVTPQEIAWLRKLCAAGVPLSHGEILHKGDRVRIGIGRLAGIEGELVEIGNELRLVVEFGFLGRAIHAVVTREQVRRA